MPTAVVIGWREQDGREAEAPDAVLSAGPGQAGVGETGQASWHGGVRGRKEEKVCWSPSSHPVEPLAPFHAETYPP